MLSLLVLAGCTNSKLVISPLYNRLDDQMRGEFHKLAKWTEDQEAHFELRVGTYHVWHRQNELPKYASLLKTIQASIEDRGSTSLTEVSRWINDVERYTGNARVCHPVNFSYDLMRTLTDKQVNFIERRFASERKKNFAKYNKLTAEERRKERVDTVVKWAGRAGFDFTKTQTTMLDNALAEQISLRRQYYRLVDVWAKELFIIARNQEASNYEQRMQTQINKLWTMMENGYEKEWQSNRELWQNFGYEFIQSLNYDQRIHAIRWLGKMSETITSISQDTPSFKSQNNPKHGCLPGQPIQLSTTTD